MTARLLPLAVVAGMLLFALFSPPQDGPPFDETAFRNLYIDIYRPKFAAERQPDGSRLFTLTGLACTGQPRLVQPKPAGDFRVFLVGGSVAFYLPERPRGGSWEEELRATEPGRRYEVVDCGTPGYDSYRDSLLADEVLGLSPDLLVVFSGHNEFHRPPWIRFPRLAFLAAKLRRYRAFKSLQERWLGDREVSITRRERDEQFEANIRGLARRAKAAGVRTVLCTLPLNLADYPPHERVPWSEPAFVAAMDRRERGEAAAAAALLEQFVAAHPADASARYYLGKALQRAGAPAQAEAQFRLAADEDRDERRATPARNESIRRIAREEGVALADLERGFERLEPAPGIGLFFDAIHWHADYNPFVSAAVTRAAFGPGRAVDAWLARASRPEFTPDSSREALYRILVGAGLSTQLSGEHAPRVVEVLAGLERFRPGTLERLDRLEEDFRAWGARRRYGSDEMRSWWTAFLKHGGVALRREGRYGDAARLLGSAVARDPSDRAARVHLAVALARSGRRAEALSLIERAPAAARPGSLLYDPEAVAWEACLRAGVCGFPPQTGGSAHG